MLSSASVSSFLSFLKHGFHKFINSRYMLIPVTRVFMETYLNFMQGQLASHKYSKQPGHRVRETCN